MKGLYLILLSFLFGCNLPDMQTGKEVSYYFDQPAQIWEETLPLGNGRIGMMPDGGIERENVVLNEISLWSGSKQDTDNPYAYYSLANIRRLLFEGRNDEAQDLMYKTFVCKGTGSNLGDGANAPYGSYQLFGNLVLKYTYPPRPAVVPASASPFRPKRSSHVPDDSYPMRNSKPDPYPLPNESLPDHRKKR